MMTTTETAYTAAGPVRGSCGHKHRTIYAAARCAEADQDGCRKQGGYSDRDLHESDCAIIDSCGARPCTCELASRLWALLFEED